MAAASVTTCATCGRELVAVPSVGAARAGGVGARIDGAALPRCPAGHADAGHAELGDRIVGEVRAQVWVARRGRWPWRPDRCARCGAGLTMPLRRTDRPVTVAAGAVPAFTVWLDVPVGRCVECAADNVPNDARRDLDAAVRGALGDATGAGASADRPDGDPP